MRNWQATSIRNWQARLPLHLRKKNEVPQSNLYYKIKCVQRVESAGTSDCYSNCSFVMFTTCPFANSLRRVGALQRFVLSRAFVSAGVVEVFVSY
jgi:hypothetical protein